MPGEDNLNSELYTYAGEMLHDRLLVFLCNIYMMGEIPEEWKNSTVITVHNKGDKWQVENNIEELAYLLHVINYTVKF